MVQEGEGRSEIEKKAAVNFGICVMLGIAFSSSMGGMATLIGTPPNAVMAGQVVQMTRYPGSVRQLHDGRRSDRYRADRDHPLAAPGDVPGQGAGSLRCR